MVMAPKIDKYGMKKGAWSEEEDAKLKAYIIENGYWNWREVPKYAGLSRCGKSCRLRWVNYLRPTIKLGKYTKEDDDLIIKLHNQLGNRWSAIARNLPGRSDNEIKNRWNAHLKKRAKEQGSRFGEPMSDASSSGSSSRTELSSLSSDCSVLNKIVEDRVATSESFGESETLESFWREPFLTDTYTTTTATFTADYMHFLSPPSPIIGEDFRWSYHIDGFIL